MVLYALVSGTSVGYLVLGGIIPGLIGKQVIRMKTRKLHHTLKTGGRQQTLTLVDEIEVVLKVLQRARHSQRPVKAIVSTLRYLSQIRLEKIPQCN